MSNADSRSPSTDALETLGMIHYKPEHRDAIHLAVEPVTAGEDLDRGDWIVIKDGVTFRSSQAEAHGIVDPFIPTLVGKHYDVKKGEKFWFVMKPRMVRSLRHVWEHPAFPKGE